MRYGLCDECYRTDSRGLVKSIVGKGNICHTCESIYSIVLEGKQIPGCEESMGFGVQVDVSAERKRRIWISQWVRGTFFDAKNSRS